MTWDQTHDSPEDYDFDAIQSRRNALRDLRAEERADDAYYDRQELLRYLESVTFQLTAKL